MSKAHYIKGGIHKDDRGTIRFVNDFDMSLVKRMYHIYHASLAVIRGWQGHKYEAKWFYCCRGSFKIKVVDVDDWLNPSPMIPSESFELNQELPGILSVPAGCATSIQALQEGSDLIVLSDTELDKSSTDDYRFIKDYWK